MKRQINKGDTVRRNRDRVNHPKERAGTEATVIGPGRYKGFYSVRLMDGVITEWYAPCFRVIARPLIKHAS